VAGRLSRAGGRRIESEAWAEAREQAESGLEAEPVDELTRAQARIAELERVIGRQQVDLHFFREALRLWDANGLKAGAPVSTKSSRK